MTAEELKAELDKCANDMEYTIRTYMTVKDKDGTRRRPTEKEIQHAIETHEKAKVKAASKVQ